MGRHPHKGYCDFPENGGGGHVDYCGTKMPCREHARCTTCGYIWTDCRCPTMKEPEMPKTNLFTSGPFVAASGKTLDWKIECDALRKKDWNALAKMALEILPPFRHAVGVPEGGLPFAKALNVYGSTHKPGDPVLLADDVWTTGNSMSDHAAELDLGLSEWIGVVAFRRGPIYTSWNDKLFAVFVHHGAIPNLPDRVPPEKRHTCTPGLIGWPNGCAACGSPNALTDDDLFEFEEAAEAFQKSTGLAKPFVFSGTVVGNDDPDNPYDPHVFKDTGNPFSCGICMYPRFAPLHVGNA